ncbi:hypothetical protein LR010_00265 [Candidatus Gracilibacteria bacterium]|nr:hypothetical protein [Candidatus Gracilibacteria bacterium]
MILVDVNNWKALSYVFEYKSEFIDNKATGVMKFAKGVTYNLSIERKIPINEEGKDTRTPRQKRHNNGFNYSITLDGTDFLNINNSSFKDKESALDEIAVLITIELENMNPEEMSREVVDLVKRIKFQAKGVSLKQG